MFFVVDEKVGKLISWILYFSVEKCLLFICILLCSKIIAAYPSALDELPLVTDILSIAPHRVYLISLQPNCTFFLLHWSSYYYGWALPIMPLYGVQTFLPFSIKNDQQTHFPTGKDTILSCILKKTKKRKNENNRNNFSLPFIIEAISIYWLRIAIKK